MSGLTESERLDCIVALGDAATKGIAPIYTAVERIVAERVRVVEGERDAAVEQSRHARQTAAEEQLPCSTCHLLADLRILLAGGGE